MEELLDDNNQKSAIKGGEFDFKAAVFWGFLILLFYATSILSAAIKNKNVSGLLEDLNSVILYFGIFGIPLILFLFGLLSIFKKFLDRVTS